MVGVPLLTGWKLLQVFSKDKINEVFLRELGINTIRDGL